MSIEITWPTVVSAKETVLIATCQPWPYTLVLTWAAKPGTVRNLSVDHVVDFSSVWSISKGFQ